MSNRLKISLFVLLIISTVSIIALSRWEIPAPSAEATKSLPVDQILNKSK